MFKKESIAIAVQDHQVRREPKSQTPTEREGASRTGSRVPSEPRPAEKIDK